MSEPFTSPTTPAALTDLRARLQATRWPDAPEDAGWSLGTDLSYLRELVAYWADGFDWPAQEAALGRLPRFRVALGDLGDPLRPRPSGPARPAVGPRPRLAGLVLALHEGHPAPDRPRRARRRPGRRVRRGRARHARLRLLRPSRHTPGLHRGGRPVGRAHGGTRLPRFGAAGGDIGSHVCRYLGLNHPDRVVAVHRTDAGLPVHAPTDLTPEERDWLQGAAAWGAAEGAYAAMHRSKPQTAAFGLTDSPAGLAAWIVEKLRAWSDCDGDVERRFTKDEILTNVTIYWLTGTIGSSMRMYQANAAIPPAQHARRVEVPSGFALFPGDIVGPPRAWLERTANVVRVTEPARGGHFAPFEEPELYAEELRAFFRPYR